MYEELCKAGSCTEARAIIEGRDCVPIGLRVATNWFEGRDQSV